MKLLRLVVGVTASFLAVQMVLLFAASQDTFSTASGLSRFLSFSRRFSTGNDGGGACRSMVAGRGREPNNRSNARQQQQLNVRALLAAYWAAHARTLQRLHAGTLEPNDKFVFVSVIEGGGLGNRVGPVVSGFALAVALQRTLIVKWPSGARSTNAATGEEIEDPPFEALFRFPSHSFLYADHAEPLDRVRSSGDPLEWFSVIDLAFSDLPRDFCNATALDSRVIEIWTYVPFHLMIMNGQPRLEELMRRLFERISVHELARHLLLPSFAVETHMEKVLPGLVTSGAALPFQFSACFHGRVHAGPGAHMSDVERRAFYDAALDTATESRSEEALRRYFVASDDPSTRAEVARAVRERSPGACVIDSGAEPSLVTRNSIRGNQLAAADMFLLARCENVCSSVASSFSVAATLLGGGRATTFDRNTGSCKPWRGPPQLHEPWTCM